MSNKKNMDVRMRREFATTQEMDNDVRLAVKWHSTGRTQMTTFPFNSTFLRDMGTKIENANGDKVEVSIHSKQGIEVLLNGEWVRINN